MKIIQNFFIALLLSLNAQVCLAYGDAFVMGEGRYLSVTERQKFLEKLRKSEQMAEREKYEEKYKEYLSYAGHPKKVDLIHFTKFKPIVSPELYKNTRPGYDVFMLCFGCNEGIPEKERALREQSKASFYDIWVLSGMFIMLEMDPKSKDWRVLYSGGAE